MEDLLNIFEKNLSINDNIINDNIINNIVINDNMVLKIIKIQKWFRKKILYDKNKCIAFVQILYKNNDIMKDCYYECVSVSKNFPPQKNENKFIYGKLIELSLINYFTKIGFICQDLDKNHNIGSEYMNDLLLLKIKFSIKAKLNKGGDVILINKKSTTKHNIKLNLILCVINTGKLYIFPSNIFNIQKYIKEDAGSISYKSSLFTLLDKNYSEYIYTFPLLDDISNKKLSEIKEQDIMSYLYHKFIKII